MKDLLRKKEEKEMEEKTGEVIEDPTKMMVIMTGGKTKTEISRKENYPESSNNQEEKEPLSLRSMKLTQEQMGLGLLLK